MKIIPAIDILGGKVVRLKNGDYNKVSHYNVAPLDAAKAFESAGAKYLHIVDLDGAREGTSINLEVIRNIIKNTSLSVEVGGGIRSLKAIESYLSAGADKVIIGSSALDCEFLLKAISKYGQKIEVSVDAKDGLVRTAGWMKSTNVSSLEFCKSLEKSGICRIIYTDISKDGALKGTNLEIYNVLCQTLQVKITASGGISSLKDIQNLKNMGVDGAIIGKALYDRVIRLKDAIQVAGE